ncbi:hypothetical protein QE612_11240 [Streptococcus suis]|uniref:hypothetical protein n=1 Tax=Streptococcus suis TaxID=1307 RepID=UPI002002D83E|nr:hypothetical protein [Streptococcus suis]MDW8667586.1 hypothetical protein [Streptococcus suis]HEM4089471.1 hypothetical protein [Streptococcus suis]
MINGFYPTALDVGIDPFSFWEYTLLELKELVESYNRQQFQKQKEIASHHFIQSQMIARFVSLMFQEKGEAPDIWEFYPTLFEEDRAQIEQARIERDLKIHQEQMRAYAERMRGRFTTSE